MKPTCRANPMSTPPIFSEANTCEKPAWRVTTPVRSLLNVDKVKDIPKQIDGTGRVQVFVNVVKHFKTFSIKTRLFHEQIAHWRLEVVV